MRVVANPINRSLVIALWVGLPLCAFAQANVQVLPPDGRIATCIREQGKLPVDSALSLCLDQFRLAGYLEANLDSSRSDSTGTRYFTHLGPRYSLGAWSERANANADYGAVRLDTLTTPQRIDQLPQQAEAYLDNVARDGYPFARVRHDALRLAADSLSGRRVTWSGPRIVYGGIRYGDVEEVPVSLNYLQRYLGVEPGRLYRQREVDDIERRLRGLRFLQVGRPPVIVFESSEAYLYVDAKSRKTSRFDFLLGFLPNSEANDGQLLLTGDLTLELENSLRRGERVFLSFERLQPEATEVVLEGSYPYVFDSPFGVQATFGLYRQQSDWLRINYEAGASYALGGGDAYEFYYEGGVAQALGFDTLLVERTQQLPEVLDATRNGFGLRARFDRRDDVFDTRAGWRLVAEGSAALRSVEVPGSVRALGEGVSAKADSVEGTSGQFRFSLDFRTYVPTGRRTTLAVLLRAASILGEQTPLRNELHRIGGNRLLRGFDEQTIDAQHFAVLSLEYRLLLGGGSYLYVFADQSALGDPYRLGNDFDQPTGFGAGLRLGTRTGALNLTYAYGRRSGAPFDWQRAKVHIGYASRF